MTTAELMNPRFIQRINYPNPEEYKEGKIYELGEGYKPINWFRKYPDVFREMHWAEERKPADMPLFLRYDNDDEVVKVIHYSGVRVRYATANGKEYATSISQFEPATQEEYTAYVNSTYKNKEENNG